MWKLLSPDEQVQVCLWLDDSENALRYSASLRGKPVLDDSNMGVVCSLGSLTKGFTFQEEARGSIRESYSLPAGKKAVYENNANELALRLRCGDIPFIVRLRAYDDGFAFRYEIPAEGGPIQVMREDTGFQLAPGFDDLWLQGLACSYEATYDHSGWEDTAGRDYGMPCLFHSEGAGVWAMITEANVYNTNGSYCSCHLRGAGGRGMRLEFAPEEMGRPIPSPSPFCSPWRVVMIAPSLDALVNSTLNYNLNPPTQMRDTGWIKPGRCLWAWWEFENGAELFTEQKRYVDFAAAMGFEGLTVDADWDITWLKDLCDYAHSKNIVVWLWSAMQYIDTPETANEKIALWASCGVDGLKVDFFQNDSRHTMWQYEMIADIMTEHGLMINFHGATKCMGEGRTWPNLMTAEGVLGLEHYKWSALPDARHNCTLPFTRNVVGPMDYTPTGFSNKNRNTTLGHQMALSVVYESGASHIAASIYYLEAWRGTDFLRRMKPVYEGVKVLSGYPGHHAAIMRWVKGEWLVGCITNRAMTMRLPLDFLPDGTFEAEIYEDDSSGEMMCVSRKNVTSADVLELPLLAAGGAGVYITRSVGPLPGGITSGYMSKNRVEYAADTALPRQGSEPVEFENGQTALLLNGGACFTVEAQTAGRHTVRLFYTAAQPWTLRVSNGADVREQPMPQSGSHKVFITRDVVLPLERGKNALLLERAAGGIPAIEKLHLIDNSPPRELFYPAQSARLSGGAELTATDCGTQKITGLGLGGEAEFSGICLPECGKYLLRFEYSAGESRDLFVEVNGEKVYKTNLHNTSGWGFPAWDVREGREIKIDLREGENRLRLYNQGGRAAHLFGIALTPDL